MATNSRLIVAPPVKTPLDNGLFSVAEMRPDSYNKWRMGVNWENVCPDAASTYELCLSTLSGVSAVTGAPSTKAATMVRSFWGATPFTVYGEIVCSAVGFYDNAATVVENAFSQAEAQDVESVFMTGLVDGKPVQYPHLAATAAVTDTTDTPDIKLQLAVTQLESGATTDAVTALGRLETLLSACVRGQGVIYMTPEVLAVLMSNHVITQRAGKFYSPSGHQVAVSPSFGLTPAGATPAANISWMYATGPVFMYRSSGRFVGTKESTLTRTDDTVRAIYERTYLIGYDCCLYGVAVNTDVTQ